MDPCKIDNETCKMDVDNSDKIDVYNETCKIDNETCKMDVDNSDKIDLYNEFYKMDVDNSVYNESDKIYYYIVYIILVY